KDVATDLERGDVFLPVELAQQHGVALEDLLEPAHREAGLAVVRAVCARARRHLENAERYTLAWPASKGAEVRLFCAVPLALALATIAEVEAGHDTLRAGVTPKVSRRFVAEVLGGAREAVTNDAALQKLLHMA